MAIVVLPTDALRIKAIECDILRLTDTNRNLLKTVALNKLCQLLTGDYGSSGGFSDSEIITAKSHHSALKSNFRYLQKKHDQIQHFLKKFSSRKVLENVEITKEMCIGAKVTIAREAFKEFYYNIFFSKYFLSPSILQIYLDRNLSPRSTEEVDRELTLLCAYVLATEEKVKHHNYNKFTLKAIKFLICKNIFDIDSDSYPFEMCFGSRANVPNSTLEDSQRIFNYLNRMEIR